MVTFIEVRAMPAENALQAHLVRGDLTSSLLAKHNQTVSLRARAAFVAVLLMASIGSLAWATCMADLDMTAGEQMACCAGGHDSCPMAGSAESCCKLEGQRQQERSVATHEQVRSVFGAPAAATVTMVADVSFAPVLVRFARIASPHDVLKGPSPPPYLLGSAFLI